MNMHRFVEREENSGGEIKNELIIYVNLILQAILKEKQKRKKTPASLATFSSYSRSQIKVRNPWTRIVNFKKRQIYIFICMCVCVCRYFLRNQRNPNSTTSIDKTSIDKQRSKAFLRSYYINDSLKNSPLK